MEIITEEQYKAEMDMNKEEIQRILNEGGKVTDTIIYEKDKVTTTRKIEPVNGKATSSSMVQTIEGISLQTKNCHLNFE